MKYGAQGAEVIIDIADLGNRVRLAVHSRGNPLDEQEIARLFEPYVRTKSAESGEQRGWGLGLTLVHGVVKAHGGQFGVSSSVEEGTTFWFELPKESSAVPDEA